jgi:hypothetical protein
MTPTQQITMFIAVCLACAVVAAIRHFWRELRNREEESVEDD